MKPVKETAAILTPAEVLSVEREDGSIAEFKVYRAPPAAGSSNAPLAEVMVLADSADLSMPSGGRSRRARRYGQVF